MPSFTNDIGPAVSPNDHGKSHGAYIMSSSAIVVELNSTLRESHPFRISSMSSESLNSSSIAIEARFVLPPTARPGIDNLYRVAASHAYL